MNRSRAIRLLIPLVCAFMIAPGFAEGPLNVGGLAPDAEGVPFRWNPAIFPLQYWTDQGLLGTRSNDQANQIASDAFSTWANVPTANITFTRTGALGGDVTVSNYFTVEDAINDCSTLPNFPTGIARPRTVVYDTNGSIIDLVFGVGQSNSTLGFAYPTCLTSDGANNSYNRGLAVMNGNGTTDADLKAIMIHEFGHMLGLDHSQVNVECLDFFGCDSDALAGLPTMFPILTDEAEMSTPATDDIAGLSALYPETVNAPPGRVPFATTTGKITGRIFFSDGQTPAHSINVIARKVDNPKVTAVSSVSGFLFTADNGNTVILYPGSPSLNGSRALNLIGYYEIPGLPPGNYTVEVEAIDPGFTLGSGLNPVGGLGIVFPMPSSACPNGEFFNTGDTNIDVCTDNTPITVGTITPVTDRNIILNGTPPRFDAWESGP